MTETEAALCAIADQIKLIAESLERIDETLATYVEVEINK